MQKKDTIDFFDGMCSDIIVSTRKSTNVELKKNSTFLQTEDEILRILPKNEGLYESN